WLAARARRRRAPSRPRATGALPVETRILGLAREVAAIAAAFGEDRAIPALLPAARERARSDETLGVALAWIREQPRASLEEILEAGVRGGAIRKAVPRTLKTRALSGGLSRGPRCPPPSRE